MAEWPVIRLGGSGIFKLKNFKNYVFNVFRMGFF